MTEWSPSWVMHLNKDYSHAITRCAEGSRRVVRYVGGWMVLVLTDGKWLSLLREGGGLQIYETERAAAEAVEEAMRAGHPISKVQGGENA